jgi:transposase
MDLGKKSSRFCVMNEERQIVEEGNVRNRVDKLAEVFGQRPPMQIVIEASGKSFWVADRLRELGHEPIVVDPGRTKAIGATLIKNDKLDARILANLCAARLLATIDQPSEEQRISRMPVAVRDALVRSRVKMVNMVRSLLDSEGIDVGPCSPSVFAEKARQSLEGAPEGIAAAVAPALEAIDRLTEKISESDEALKAAVASDPDAKLLMTVPGVGPVAASCFLMAIRNVDRFSSGRQVAAYLGLVPSLYASGKTMRRGRITKRGNRHGRWVLTQSAQVLLHIVKKESRLKAWGHELAARAGKKKAVVAVARKLATVLWAMLKHRRAFEPRLVGNA